MRVRQKKGRAQKNVRPGWWKNPTFYTYGADRWNNGEEKIRVELILPDATRVNLGYFPRAMKPEELRHLVGLRFKEIWDPKNCRQRTPTT